MISCAVCQREGKSFTCPYDSIGVALMQQHLKTEHDITAPPK